jgi:hypothetical protein
VLQPVPLQQRLLLGLQVRLVLDLLQRRLRAPVVPMLRMPQGHLVLRFGLQQRELLVRGPDLRQLLIAATGGLRSPAGGGWAVMISPSRAISWVMMQAGGTW